MVDSWYAYWCGDGMDYGVGVAGCVACGEAQESVASGCVVSVPAVASESESEVEESEK